MSSKFKIILIGINTPLSTTRTHPNSVLDIYENTMPRSSVFRSTDYCSQRIMAPLKNIFNKQHVQELIKQNKCFKKTDQKNVRHKRLLD